MNRRPVCLVCIGWMIILWILKAFGAPVFGEPAFPEPIRKKLENGCVTSVTGEVVSRRKGDRSIQYILGNSYATVCGRKIHFSKLNMTMSPDAAFRIEPRSVSPAKKEDGVLFLGSVVRVTGKLETIASPANPGEFDRRSYYAAQKIYQSIYAERVRVEKEGGGFSEGMQRLRESMAERLTESMRPAQAGVLRAMLLGDRSLLPEEVRTNYAYGGVMHILAISGLHIVMLGMLLYGFLERTLLSLASVSLRRKGKKAAALLSWMLMGLYTVFTGMPVPAVRAWIMYGILLLAEAAEKSYDSLCALSVAAMLLLLTNPACLFYAGFQLSFAAVAGISAVYPALLSLFPESFWRKGSRKKQVLEKIIESSLAYLAVALATLPLIARYFYEIPLWSLAVNLLLVPAMTLVMALGTTGLALAMACPAAGRLLLIPVDIILQIYLAVTGLIRRIPSSMWICGRPDFRQLIVYYLILTAWVFYRKDGSGLKKVPEILCRHIVCRPFKERRSWLFSEGSGRIRMIDAGALVFLVLCFVLRAPEPFSITMLDVGQGDCCLIRTEEGAAFLVDGGSSSVNRVGHYRILPYLKEQGIAELDGIFLSHADEDHINGVEELLNAVAQKETAVRIGRLWMPAWMRTDKKGVHIAGECQKAGVSVSYAVRGARVTCGKTVIRVLHPFASGGAQEGNAGSMVLEVSHGDFRALFTGDLEQEGERELIPDLNRVQLLKVAHHGSAYSSSDAFLEHTGRPVGLISAAKHSIYHHPHRETIRRLQKAGIVYFCTKDSGAIRVTPQGKTLRIREYRKDGAW
uniref:DNA internalization-related competence protein ComEC/Rec2 n=1 Tax=Eubacterium cellulosolvens TaxID=29322 RepID=UPI000481EEDD